MIVTDFDGFVATADAVGGAVVCIPEAIVAERSKLTLDAGTQRLSGIELLSLHGLAAVPAWGAKTTRPAPTASRA